MGNGAACALAREKREGECLTRWREKGKSEWSLRSGYKKCAMRLRARASKAQAVQADNRESVMRNYTSSSFTF